MGGRSSRAEGVPRQPRNNGLVRLIIEPAAGLAVPENPHNERQPELLHLPLLTVKMVVMAAILNRLPSHAGAGPGHLDVPEAGHDCP
jgi:hypothetical protein